MKKINVLLPVETIARELDAKLFFAVSLAKKGVNVIVAQHDFFNTGCYKFKGGVYIGKNVFKLPFLSMEDMPYPVLRYYNELKENDITLLHLDEEAAIWVGREEEWRYALDNRLNPDMLKDTDYIFAWGGFQAEHYQNKSSLFPRSHIINSGHPKYDLCKPKFREYYKKDIDEIKEKYGSYILINTRTGNANPLMGLRSVLGIPSEVLDDLLAAEFRNPKAALIRLWVHENKVMTNFIALVHELSDIFPNKKFVVRPHPGENPEYYKDVFSGTNNVHVEKRLAVQPWIMGADMVIFDGCTTGLESFLAEVSTISYQSLENKEFDLLFPNQCGVKCKTVEEVLKVINESERDPESFTKKNSFTPVTKSLLKNIDSDTYDDFFNMVDKIIEDKRLKNVHNGEISIFRLRLREIIYSVEQFCRTLIRFFFPAKRTMYLRARAHYPGFNRGTIDSKIRTIERVLNKKVEVNYLSERLLVVTSLDDEE